MSVVSVEPSQTEPDVLDFLDGEGEVCFSLPWDDFEALYLRVKEQRALFASFGKEKK